jgi:hypothetical protein
MASAIQSKGYIVPEGHSFTVPVAGLSEKVHIEDNGKEKAYLRAIIGDDLNKIYLTLKRVGGRNLLSNVSLSVLRQERPIPLEGTSGDYMFSFTNNAGIEITANIALLIEYRI